MSPSNSSQPQKLKRVRFAEFAKLTLYAGPSKEMLHKRWYTKQEKDYFKFTMRHDTLALRETAVEQEIKKFAHAVVITKKDASPKVMALNLKDEGIDAHGIEHVVSRHVINLIAHKRKLLISQVLYEQQRQKMLGIKDDDLLAEVSRKGSKFTREWSSHIAIARAA